MTLSWGHLLYCGHRHSDKCRGRLSVTTQVNLNTHNAVGPVLQCAPGSAGVSLYTYWALLHRYQLCEQRHFGQRPTFYTSNRFTSIACLGITQCKLLVRTYSPCLASLKDKESLVLPQKQSVLRWETFSLSPLEQKRKYNLISLSDWSHRVLNWSWFYMDKKAGLLTCELKIHLNRICRICFWWKYHSFLTLPLSLYRSTAEEVRHT